MSPDRPTDPPPSRPILMAGSSIFEQWPDVGRLHPTRPVVNAAIGGTQTHDWIDGPLVSELRRHRPAALFFYCGSNNLSNGDSADLILAHTLALLRDAGACVPGLRVFWGSILRCREKEPRFADLDRINTTMAGLAASETPPPGLEPGGLIFVDFNPLFHEPAEDAGDAAPTPGDPGVQAGRLREELFVEDQVHLTDAAYDRMTAHARPILTAGIPADA